PHEDCRPFVRMARRLHQGGLRVPAIHAADLEHGFLLLSDLGTTTFLEAIQAGLDDAQGLQQHYRGALRALVQLQQCPATDLPAYDAARLREELEVFPYWYLGVHHGWQPDAAVRQQL